ncbi:hypothetical protein CHELA40_50543 [Chelatococcus asaccharovorans]|nr:hypothetical protein CHELA17_20512 [Chelatococcus asaccharovorans]CAH1693262.1 hypothetical protein CHELA40_50543 [Chelatococcus asaccharovorans]
MTPWRSLNSQVVSSIGFQDSASPGTSCIDLSRMTSVSKMLSTIVAASRRKPGSIAVVETGRAIVIWLLWAKLSCTQAVEVDSSTAAAKANAFNCLMTVTFSLVAAASCATKGRKVCECCDDI